MKKYLQNVLLIVGLVSTLAWAAPRVALMKVSSGTATLDGEKVKVAKLLEEGQTLVLTA